MRLRCDTRGCTSYMYTKLNYDLVNIADHNHLSDLRKFSDVLFKDQIKKRSLQCSETSREVISNVESLFKDDIISYDHKATTNIINGHRKRNNFTKNQEYDIPEELTVTKKGREFLLYDSGMHDDRRVLLFSTAENMEHLKFNTIFMMDGTFR